MKGKLFIDIQPDGSVKLDARGLEGDEKEILAELESLTQTLGGDLKIEKHVEGAHHHHHGHKHLKGGHHH